MRGATRSIRRISSVTRRKWTILPGFLQRTSTLLVLLAGALLPAPSWASTLFALVDTGEIFVSEDDASTWEVRSALPVSDAVGMVALSSPSDLFLATRSGIIYHSSDAGVLWDPVGSVPESDVVSIASVDENILVALGRQGTVWQSEDFGSTFSVIGTLTASDLAGLIASGSTFFAATDTGSIFHSLDGGASWALSGTATLSSAVALASFDTTLYLLSEEGDVWQSLDDGSTWQTIGAISQVHCSSLIADIDGTLFAAIREGSIAVSSDGTTWDWRGTTNQLHVTALAQNRPVSDVPGSPQTNIDDISLGAPYPNPLYGSHPNWSIPVRLDGGEFADVTVFDTAGRIVRPRSRYDVPAGEGVIAIGADELPVGVFLARITNSSGKSQSVPLVRIR